MCADFALRGALEILVAGMIARRRWKASANME
jgi:hypothetical protein